MQNCTDQLALHLKDGVGLWNERLSRTDMKCRPALFLDRDGVVVEEVNYLGRVQDVKLISGVGASIRSANEFGIPVILVTNQAGIARGYYGWVDFQNVQREICRCLAKEEAELDLILACAYHANGVAPFRVDQHPWRKPNAGMLQHAGDVFGVDLKKSYVVGDRVSDLLAGMHAGIAGGSLVMTGHGRDEIEQFETRVSAWASNGFYGRISSDSASAIEWWLSKCRSGASLWT